VSDDDARLREVFARQRREDARDAPLLASLLREDGRAADRRRPRWAVAGVAALTAAAALLFALALVPRIGQPANPPFDPSLLPIPASGELRTSTDVLLRTPGAALLGAQPPDLLPALAPSPSPPSRPTSSGPQTRLST